MTKVYTSRYSNKELQSGNYTAVGITLGRPKFNLGQQLAGNLYDIAPKGLFGKGYGREEYKEKYFEKMDKIGVERIRRQLDYYRSMGKDVVLLCFEDVRDESQFCHRNVFAEWWEKNTGERIEELPDPAECKYKKKKEEKKEEEGYSQLSLFGFPI